MGPRKRKGCRAIMHRKLDCNLAMKGQKSCADSNIDAAMVSFCPNSSDGNNQGNNPIRDFETMSEDMDDQGCSVEETCHVADKKSRLRIDQVRALEKSFEVDNKLDPDRKIKLAQEVRLEPRQVAVWFQNRRARWKTKRLEKDYVFLKANYDGLRLQCEKIRQDNESLLQEIKELKLKLNESSSSKQEEMVSNVKQKARVETLNNSPLKLKKDGSSEDSESSAILNQDSNINRGVFCKKESSNYLGNVYLEQQPFVKKIKEYDVFEEESCNCLIFWEDQAPTLHWYLE